MSIITKCPGCGTTFRVTPQQLQAQQGMVRCGRCAKVFDGFKTLATLPAEAPGDVATEKALRADTQISAPIAAVIPSPVTEPATEPEQELAWEPAKEVRREAVFAAVPPASSASPVQDVVPEPVDEVVVEREPVTIVPVAKVAPARFQPPPAPVIKPPPRRRSGAWTFGALLLLIGLAVQGAYYYRSDIAAIVPEARPYLNKMCELLRCTVALPQRPRQISIEASDMQATDPANPGVIALTATLRNQATIELGYPALDVVLTNTKEHTVARRIFLPAEYLGAGKDPRTGIAPNAEFTVRLDLDTGDLGAAGFRLDVLPAPGVFMTGAAAASSFPQ